jgi:hypothetical protein
MELELRDDYALQGDVTDFEAYMFITSKKFMSEHEELPHCNINVFHGTDTDSYLLGELKERKDALHNFNVYLTQSLGHFPKASELGCFIMYMSAEYQEEDADRVYIPVYDKIAEIAYNFCKEQGRIIAMVPHLHQGNNMPHAHILYQRDGKKHNELQDYIRQKLQAK